MSDALCDTSILIRLITGDDPDKQDRVIALFEQVEQGILSLGAPMTVIADAVFVLTSKRLYNKPRDEVAAKLTTLVRLPHFHVTNRRTVLYALQLFGASTYLDFGDAVIVAQAHQSGVQTVYTYDADFDRVAGLIRKEP
jgi:predicted nucleic acid-binding protein